VAGFSAQELDLTLEDNELVIEGRQTDDAAREFLHRGIAARQFRRIFVLADGMNVVSASLDNGLLAIDLERPEPQRLVRKIEIRQSGS
jgi:HSP20 family molecular chaperone IbpA